MPGSTVGEWIARRSRAVTIAALCLLALLAWAYILSGAGMARMDGTTVVPPRVGWPIAALMWAAMMVAMMLPSAAPAIQLYARVHRHSAGTTGLPPTAAFLAGYLGCWFGFSMVAASAQLAFASPISMALESHVASVALLIVAGLYQLSPLKNACLSRCRSPSEFLSRHYRPGNRGAIQLGLLYGTYCVGCCWLLMALLFVGGVINLLWIAGLTLLVAAEKLLPGGQWIARIAGIAFIGWGVAIIVT